MNSMPGLDARAGQQHISAALAYLVAHPEKTYIMDGDKTREKGAMAAYERAGLDLTVIHVDVGVKARHLVCTLCSGAGAD